jgi:rhodanese-related sulfurtransferase
MLGFFKKIFGGSSVNLKELVSNGAVIIDVRSPNEYKTGHIQGSKNYPLDILSSKLNELQKPGKPIITVCRSGTRSRMAKGILKSAGIEVYDGGAWISLKNKIA